MQAETRQMRIVDPILMGFRPHPKAKSLGELAMHIVTLQGSVAELSQNDIADASPLPPPDVQATSRQEILAAFTQSQNTAKAIVNSTDDEAAMAEWKLVKGDVTLWVSPRIAFWRSIMLDHYYHHRGQLAAYLRELDVPLPSIYGPSADTNPFA